ncbi:unnamed protein product [Protopolystoma xenopodis]|uniref:BZIP domain-containing protein n=1 Tax=Protopolystoma xenopodis TaxID=117903 RepID=A0A448XGE8_9PLAT|nr:unnamed protein product [Protopolystoma xenopodis]
MSHSLCAMKRTIAASSNSAPIPSRSSESARDCRKRKALRIQYLAESVRQREMTVLKMVQDINKLMEACRMVDAGEYPQSVINDLGISLELCML